MSLAPIKLTDAEALRVPAATGQYATKPPFNLGNTLILILETACFALYRVTGERIGPLTWLGDSANPLWSKTDPDVLYYCKGNQFKSYNVFTGAHSIIHSFPKYSEISDGGEGDLGDGDHIVLIGDKREVFVYRISTDTQGHVLDIGGRHLDSLYITPNGNAIISWGIYGTEMFTGVEMFDGDMNFIRKLTPYVGHKDVTRDVDGSECMIITDNNTNAIMKVPCSGARWTVILPPLDWAFAVHISCPSQAGFAIVSTYAAGHPGMLLKVPLDGTLRTILLGHGSIGLGYYDAPKASISYDGKWLAWNSNKDGRPNAYIAQLAGDEPPVPPTVEPVPIPEPSSAPAPKWKRFPNQKPLKADNFPARDGEAGFVYDGGNDVKLVYNDGPHKWILPMKLLE